MKIKKHWIFLLISFFLVGCDSLLKVDFLKKLNQDIIASLKIGQSEVIGSCTFNSSSQNVNNTNFSYLLTFSKEINSAVVGTQTISNLGTGGATDLNWAIQDCGDGKNFKIEPTLINGDGTIAPDVSTIVAAVSSPDKVVRLENNVNQITVNYDTQSPSVLINQSSSENVGSCSFTGTNDPTNIAGFSYKITFSEKVNPATFLVSDIINTGTGAGSSLVWGLENCGDNQNFKLTANSLTGDGTVIPVIFTGVLTDLAGNLNTISLSVDNSITYDSSSLLVNINQSITEVIGTCSFSATTDPTNVAGFSYKVLFSKNINVSSFTISDISNSGTSGNIGWSLASCGDERTFKLVADTIEFNGTVIPVLDNGVVLDTVGSGNQASTGIDNSVTFDNVRPGVAINQATTETVGSCSFNATTDPTHLLGFNYKIVFSENINTSSFATGDITNNGTSGLVGWNLESCGDGRVFKLTASSVAIDGTVIPVVNVNSVSDLAGNLNTLSTATDNSVTYDAIAPNVTINQSVAETVGSCSFVATNDPTNVAGFSYKVHFLEAIDTGSFNISDISNIGTGGSTTLTWQLENCGDDQNFKLTANSVVGEGTIIPRIGANQVYDVAGNLNILSTSTDGSVTFDTTSPSVTVNQSVAETVGSCSFVATNDPTNAAGFSYKVAFSEAVNAASFTVADIVNSGTGGGTTLTWALASCGDNQHFKLTVNAVSGDGTIIPVVNAGGVSDVAGNLNTLSTATDNSITYDTISPGITISRSVVETVGSCSFTGTNATEGAAGFNFKVVFSEKINNSSFTVADVTNGGTGGATTLTWSLASCGDDQNYRLTVSAITGEGTVIPRILASRVTDVAGNQNTLSVSSNGTVTYELLGWRQEAYIKSVNSVAGDNSGNSVSISGDTLAVGACRENSNATTITNGAGFSGSRVSTSSGAVYVYKRTGNTWAQEAYIKASNNGVGDCFGGSVSLRGDTLAVGASGEDSDATTITNGVGFSGTDGSPYTDNGAVYVYKRTGNNWAQEAYIKAVNNGSGDNFGISVSVSGDTLAVGARIEGSNATTITNGSGFSGTDTGANGSGAVYVYKRTGSNWAQEAYIKAVNNGINDYFGSSVSISGESLVVTTYFEDSNATTITNGTRFSGVDSGANDSGAAYIYKRTGNNWAQEAYIKAINNGAGDNFGNSVSLSGDTLAVGAYYEDSDATTITSGASFSGADAASNSGAVYVYKRTGVIWAQEAYVKPVNNSNNAYFGNSVSLSGNTLAVGASQESYNATTITDGAGFSGTRTSTFSGAVYVYKRTGNTWEQEAYIKAINNNSHDYFGSSVSISGDTLAVGAIGEDSEAATITNGAGFSGGNVYTDSGAVYVYRNNARLFNTQDVFRTNVSTTSLTLNWIKSGFKTTGYFIAYAQGLNAPVDCHSGTIVDVGNSTSYTFNSLSAGTHYSFRICSYDSNANLSEGYVISFQTASLLPEPGDLSLSTVTPDREARITWTSAGGSVTGYRLVYQQNSVAPSTCNSGTIIDIGNVLTYQFTGLLTNTDYGVRVCSYDALGNLSIGKYIGIKTSLALNPINVYTTSTAVTNDRLTVNWTNVSDRVTGFIVAWAAGSNAPSSCSAGTFIDAGNVTSYSITGLAAGASYGIRVCAYEAGGTNTSLGVSLVGNVRNDGWVQEAYIKAVNNGIYDSFGYSISISGDTLAVGAFGEDSNATIITNGPGFSGTDVASNSDTGAVYVYKRAGTNWEQEAYVKAVNSGNNDRFGNSVSMSGDTLAVGAYREASNATTITNGPGVSGVDTVFYSGAVYVYKRAGTNWAQEAYIKAVNNGSDDSFGQSVSISGDTLAVAVPNEDSNATIITNGTGFSGTDSSINSQNGAVYVYKRTGNNWAQEAYVKASNNGAGDNFGSSVSISGETLVVGAFYEDSNATTITNGTGVSGVDTGADNSGAVYVYKRSGSNWAQEAYIKAANSGSQDYFGYSVSISGETLAVGAYQEDSNATTITNGTGVGGVDTGADNSGAVYVYKRAGSNWAQEAYIKAVNSQTNDYFGISVSISGDTLAVGAHQEDSNATTITNGTSFSGTDSSINSQNGAVYVYKRTGSSWAQEAYIKAVNNESNDYFGSSVSISGDTLVVGAYSENSNATTITNGTGFNESGTSAGSGAVYIFRNNARLFSVAEIFPVITSNSISLKWNKTGGTALGYGVNFELGIVTPPLCSLSMDYDLGNNNELLLESLTSDTDYSLRFCVYDDSNQFVEDKVINLKTKP